jgi:D-glycero-D-manno-heptose 1,7-bisphosphate phosphatase
LSPSRGDNGNICAMPSPTMISVFLDRDGVINRHPLVKPYVTAPEELQLLPCVPEAIRLLNEAGHRAIVVTNQRGISLGLYDESDLERIHRRMREELARASAQVDAVYHCPHDADSCTCRKPDIGMFLQAQQDFPGLRFTRSIVIGDGASDLQAATRLACRTVLIGAPGNATDRELAAQHIVPDFRCESLWEAVTAFVLPTCRAWRLD